MADDIIRQTIVSHLVLSEWKRAGDELSGRIPGGRAADSEMLMRFLEGGYPRICAIAARLVAFAQSVNEGSTPEAFVAAAQAEQALNAARVEAEESNPMIVAMADIGRVLSRKEKVTQARKFVDLKRRQLSLEESAYRGNYGAGLGDTGHMLRLDQLKSELAAAEADLAALLALPTDAKPEFSLPMSPAAAWATATAGRDGDDGPDSLKA